MTTITAENAHPKGPVTILGDAYVGETLIARANSVGDEDGIDFSTAAYQWLRDGKEIVGATAQTYSVATDDVGTQISVRFTYTDFGGTKETVTSRPEATVPAAGTPIPKDDLPFNPFAVLGDAIVGEKLTARPNGISDDNGIDSESRSFQWLRDGVAIEGATDQTYVVTEADEGSALSVIYSYEDLLGNEKSITSNPKPKALPSDEPEPIVRDDDDSSDTHLIGTSGSDTLSASVGLKRISGQENTDEVYFMGNQSDYIVMLDESGVTVSDNWKYGFGAIELDNVELIDFGQTIAGFDGPFDLSQFGGHAALDRETLEAVIEVYIAYFNRAPDAIGLGFWGTAVADGASIEEIAALFANQDETRATYADATSNRDFAEQVYNNVLGRTPDDEGLTFWAEALNTGAVSRDEFILEVLDGAKSALKLDLGFDFIEQQLADRKYLDQKVDLGAYFAVHKGLSNVEDAATVMEIFDGTQSGLFDAVSRVDTLYEDALDPLNGDFVFQLVGVLDGDITF